MKGLLDLVGFKCRKGFEVKILKSNAGYYIGTFDDQEGPNCRISAYGESKDDPNLNIVRDCIENDYCSQGNCGIGAN